MEVFEIFWLALAAGLSILAISKDVSQRTIPNWLCLVTAVAGLLYAVTTADAETLLMHLAHLLVALAIGMAFFALRWWGGGDAKFYAAVTAWFPLSAYFQLVFWISIVGLMLVIVTLAKRWRRLANAAEKSVGLPYGVAIGAGMIITLVSSAILD